MLFGAVIIPYNILVSTIVTGWLLINGTGFGPVRRLTSKRRWVWYPTFRREKPARQARPATI